LLSLWFKEKAMKKTNVHNLPSVFERFDEAHAYSSGGSDYSVTTLIDSPRIKRLRSEHYSDIEEDVSQKVWSILGTAVHAILQDGAEKDQVVEERFFADIEVEGAKVSVSGQVDLQTPVGTGSNRGMILSDYKTTGAYAVQANPEGKPEHIKQLNLYAALARLNGVKVSGLEIIAIIRDWSAAGLDRNADYPVAPIVRIPIGMWDEDDAYEYLKDRVAQHQNPNLQECTYEEMWAKPPVFALHEMAKTGGLRKRATKLFDNLTDAEEKSLDIPGSVVVSRPRVFTRCEGNYCNVSKFCEQFAEIKRGTGSNEGN
jgi:hypothetical protein